MAFTIKKIILTGASGFVGSRFLKDFGRKYEIKPISLRRTPIETIDFNGIETVVHCAALVHQMTPLPEEEYFKANHDLTLRLAEAARNAGVRHFIFLSTAHVFGDSGSVSNHEGLLSPTTSCHPRNAYSRSKLAAENDLLKLASPYFKVSIIRPPMVYGEGAKGNIVSLVRLVEKIPVLPLGFRRNRRSLVYVGNLSHFIQGVVERGESRIYLPQDPHPVSTYEMTHLIAEVLEKKRWTLAIPQFLVRFLGLFAKSFTSRLFGTLALDSSDSNRSLNYSPAFTTKQGFINMLRNSD